MRTWLLRFVYLLILLIIFVVGINFYDPGLSEEAKRLAAPPQNTYAHERNLYVLLRGIDAPAGASPVHAGLQRIAVSDELAPLFAERFFQGVAKRDEVVEKQLEFTGKIDFCDDLQEQPCWTGVETKAAQIAQLRAANAELYSRYLRLHEASGYFDFSRPTLEMPLIYAPRQLRQLFLAQVAIRIKQGPAAERRKAFEALRADIRTWRHMLGGEGELIAKMLALSYLHADYLLLGEIVADSRFDVAAHAREIEATLDTMQPTDWRIGSFVGREHRFHAVTASAFKQHAYLYAPKDADEEGLFSRINHRVQMHGFNLNASINRSAQFKLRLRELLDAPPEQYRAARNAYDTWLDERLGWDLGMIHNPIGRYMSDATAANYADFGVRALDGAAFQQLVRLCYRMRRTDVGHSEIADFLATHPEWAVHPASGAPFVWNAQLRQLGVTTLQESPGKRRYHLTLFRPKA